MYKNFFSKENTSLENNNQKSNSNSIHEQDNDWNIVDENLNVSGKSESENVDNNSNSIIGNYSQKIIVTTINNRLSELSDKMDLIIEKLEKSDDRISTIENKNDRGSIIFNNEDIKKLLGETTNNNNEIDIDESDNNNNISKSPPISIPNILSNNNNYSFNNNGLYNGMSSNVGLLYFTNINSKNSNMRYPNIIPFSAP